VAMTFVICLSSLAVAYHYSVGYPVAAGKEVTPLWRFLSSLITDNLFANLLGVFLLLVVALMQQRVNYYMAVIRSKTKLPFLLFFLLYSTNMEFMPVCPASIAMLFFIPALFELFKSSERMEAARAFNATAMIGIGSLVWVHLLWFVPVYWYGMYLFNLLGMKNLLASILGVLTIYSFALGWCIWTHDFTALFALFAQMTDAGVSLSRFQWPVASCVLLLLYLSVYVRFQGFIGSLRMRKMLSFLVFFAIYAFVLLVAYSRQFLSGFLYFFYMPASLLLAVYFSRKQGAFAFLLYYIFLMYLFLSALIQIWFL
jgi:hypothetical protein